MQNVLSKGGNQVAANKDCQAVLQAPLSSITGAALLPLLTDKVMIDKPALAPTAACLFSALISAIHSRTAR